MLLPFRRARLFGPLERPSPPRPDSPRHSCSERTPGELEEVQGVAVSVSFDFFRGPERRRPPREILAP
eukprot:2209633-Pyramimonas_sp.AAC.1